MGLCWELYEKGGINTERLYDFLEKHIINKYKNKLIIMDNASSHRHQRVRDLVNKENEILYSVPYQHFTNAIENWFSVMKTTFTNIFKGSYERNIEKIKNKTRKLNRKNYL